MMVQWLKRTRSLSLGACAALLVAAGASRAGDNDGELRALVEQQNKQIQALKEKLDALATAPVARTNTAEPAAAVDPDAVKKIVADYLKDNPGAGMPPSVQTGYSTTTGFVIRSAPDPQYVKWEDDCKIPFELRVRGRIQLDYYGYKTTDRVNHQTNRSPLPGAGDNTVRLADCSQLEIKRTRLQFFGTVFDPKSGEYVFSEQKPIAIKAMKFLVDLYKTTSPPASVEWGWTEYRTAFVKGQVAMTNEWGAVVQMAAEQNPEMLGKMGVFPFPGPNAAEKPTAALSGGYYYLVGKSTPDKVAA